MPRDPAEVDRENDAWFAERRKGRFALIALGTAVFYVAGHVWGLW